MAGALRGRDCHRGDGHDRRVRVPFLSLEKLIESKATYREQDRADLVRLRDLCLN